MTFLIESLAACALFSLFVFLMSRDPVKTVFNYPPAIIERCRQGLEETVGEYEDFKDELEVLRDYMDSGEWKEDYEADEAGQVPSDLKRGVLSEDGLYNLLHDADQIIAHVKAVFTEK